MNFSRPPTCWEELMIWRAFLATYDGDAWQIIDRWIKQKGNPYYIPDNECEECRSLRIMFQESLRVTYVNKK